jgi:large subunit ribosomal protein L17
MRHSVKGRKLSRTSSHRLALLRALTMSLLKHKKIQTTLAKAKELRTFVEPMITRAKSDSVHARRVVATDINDKDLVKELFSEIVTKIGNRPGGYTRVVHLGRRKGDGAEMAIIELVDYSGIVKPKAPKKSKEEDKPVEEKVEEVKEEKKVAKKAPAKPRAKKTAEPKEKKTKAKEPKEKQVRTPVKKGS